MPTVHSLFDVRYGHSLELNRLEKVPENSGVAFVSRTAKNNGVSAWVKPIPGLPPAPAGALSVSLGGRNYTLETSLQVNPFYCGRDVSYLVPRQVDMSETEKLWWAICIRANRYRYSYGRQANRSLAELVLPDDIPEWVGEVGIPKLDRDFKESGVTKQSIDTTSWPKFRLDSLFDLSRGRRYLKRDLQPGSTPYVRATAYDNGVVARVSLEPEFEAGLITIACNGSVGETFYQPEPFVASDDIAVLRPREPVSAAAALFFCAVVRSEQYRFNYGRKWFLGRMSGSTVRFPATHVGAPDWQYADQYVRQLSMSSLVLDR